MDWLGHSVVVGGITGAKRNNRAKATPGVDYYSKNSI